MTVKRLMTLVSTNWLHEAVSGGLKSAANGTGLRILDTSFVTDKSIDSYKESYQKGHIPYSLFFDLHKCVDSTPLIPRNLPDVNCFTDYVQSLGICSNTHVIAYDRFGPLSSFRTWWTFRFFGHKNISVLDGGLRKWVNDGYEVTTEEPKVERSKFEAVINPSLLRTYEDVMINLSNKTEQVIDARDEDKFDGTAAEEGGHIPGAKNIPFQSLFNEDGTMKSEHDLKACNI
ncbi:hypothetical protein ACJMK2_036575 [Sinanodonta woodiana]|uniref:Rhodanese domain-containing protein n=1 Tax=Sinanodonta woodiana TaxID=1069815 RepID=A0ABD3WI02_SINWO